MPLEHQVKFMSVLAVYSVFRLIVQPSAQIHPEAILFADPSARIAKIDVLMMAMKIVCLPSDIAALFIALQDTLCHSKPPPLRG